MIILLPARVQENRLFNSPDDPHAQLKQEAAEFAVRFVESGMIIGLGTGSTAIFATRKISALLRDGSLKYISGFATSQATQNEAQQLGIPMIDTSLALKIDLTIDGADEVDPQFNLIKD
jgi:ribose 5-phosphate isomerase A